jgi:hypothetical protein
MLAMGGGRFLVLAVDRLGELELWRPEGTR